MTLSDLTVTPTRKPDRLALKGLLLLAIVIPVVGWLWWRNRTGASQVLVESKSSLR